VWVASLCDATRRGVKLAEGLAASMGRVSKREGEGFGGDGDRRERGRRSHSSKSRKTVITFIFFIFFYNLPCRKTVKI